MEELIYLISFLENPITLFLVMALNMTLIILYEIKADKKRKNKKKLNSLTITKKI